MRELSDKQLKIGIWWVTHRHQLKKWWVSLLAVADVLLFLYLLFSGIVLLVTWKKFTLIPYQISQPVIDFKSYQKANAPVDLRIVSTKTIRVPNEQNKYHLLAEIQNPNLKWSAPSFDYHFVLGGKEQEKRTSFFLPNEQRFLIYYNAESTSPRPEAKLIIDQISWRRQERPEHTPALNFEIKNPQASLIPLPGVGRSAPTSYSTRATAEITNKSVYNFWQVKFIVVLYQGREPVALNEITLDKFLAQESREVGVSWKEAYPSISKVSFIPEVNVLDPNTLFETDVTEIRPLS